MENFNLIWKILEGIVYLVGFVMTVIVIVGSVTTFVAWSKGIIKPLWRLGLGLSKREIYIVGSSENCNSLLELLKNSSLFKTKNIRKITNKNDVRDIENANLVLIQLSDSPVSIEDLLKYKKPETAVVVYAKPREISNWDVLDEHRNISVSNLRGRLLTDLLNALMTTAYDKR
jgi:hypothetical protein